MCNSNSASKRMFLWGYGLISFFLVFSFIYVSIALAEGGAPTVDILAPGGIQSFSPGQTINIRWTQTNADTISIGLKACYTCQALPIFEGPVDASSQNGSYNWVVPDTIAAGDKYQVEIRAYRSGFDPAWVIGGYFTINNSNAGQVVPNNQNNVVNTNNNSQASANAYQAVVKVKTFMLGTNYLLEQLSEGSGAIIDSSGIVLTNDHVVSARSSYDGSEYDTTFQICLTTDISEKPSCDYLAKLISRDEDKDLALLQIVSNTGKPETRSFPYITISSTDSTQVNDQVTAIGYPSIGEETITTTNGIISGKTEEYGNKWIKTDAVISFGSSGGAAINAQGQLVGITTQVSSDVSGELGYLLNSASIFDWVELFKSSTPTNSAIIGKLVDFAKKQKILEKSNKFIQLYPGYQIVKPETWSFSQTAEDAMTISQKNDADSGYVLIHLLKSPYLTSLNDVKPMLLRYFNDNGLSSIIKFTKEKEVKINNFKGKLVTLSVKGQVFNSYVFPNKEYLIWIERSYGKNDKDKKTVDGIINSFKIIPDKSAVTEIRKYTNSSPKFSLNTNADWAIMKQDDRAYPLKIQNKKIREAFVTFALKKTNDATQGLSNEEYISSRTDEINATNQVSAVIDYKYVVGKTSAHFKLSNNLKDVAYIDGIEKTVSDNKILAYDRDYYIKIGDSIMTVNLTVFTENKKVFDNALLSFNKMLSTLVLK